ncbi:EamA family transporter [Streptomyces sp. V2]|uniref:EamA family transporter n=1 Tax=Streptomyces TaxID=1883 RepID=UPI0006EB3E97|nr:MULTISPECIES: EamA family transporter [Streptomyces]PWG13322.1 EamA family transporter [Streptomyces sp. V2]
MFLINYAPTDELSTVGVAFALASAACWGAYMLIGAHVGHHYRGRNILAPATLWAALLTVPVAVVEQPAAFLDPRVLGAGLVVAVLSTVVANSLELASLQRISAGTFGILVSLEPVMAAFVGLLLLDQHLTWAQWLAAFLIVTASIGMTADQRRRGSGPSGSAACGERLPPSGGVGKRAVAVGSSHPAPGHGSAVRDLPSGLSSLDDVTWVYRCRSGVRGSPGWRGE